MKVLNNYFKYFILLFIFLSLLGCSNLFDSDVDDNKIEKLKIGIIVPQSNKLISVGLSILDIYNYSFTQINLNGGINGKQVELVVVDGGCSVDGGKIAAMDLIDKYDVDLIVGGICSETTIGASKVAEKNEKILITSTSSSHLISNLGDFIFRTTNSNSIFSKALAEEIFFNGISNVALIVENSSYSDSYGETFISEFKKFGGEVLYYDSFDIFENDFTYIFNNLSNTNVDTLVMFFLNDAVSSSFVTQLYDYNHNLTLYGTDLIVSNYMLNNFVKQLDGVKFAGTFLDFSNPKIQFVINEINNFAGVDVTLNIPVPYVILAYELPYLLKQVIEENNCTFGDSICVRDGLYFMESFDSFFGDIYFDINGDIDGIFPKIYQIKNSSLILVE